MLRGLATSFPWWFNIELTMICIYSNVQADESNVLISKMSSMERGAMYYLFNSDDAHLEVFRS